MPDFIKALDEEVCALEAALARDSRYIKLQEVKRLRALYGPQPSAADFSLSADALPSDRKPRIATRLILSGVSLDAINATRDFLAAQSKPVLTRDLLAYLDGMGIKFGGSSAQATLASILSRTPEFESKGGRVGWVLKYVGPTGGETVSPELPPVAMFPPSSPVEPEAGGGT